MTAVVPAVLSIWEPLSHLRRIPIHECGEPLVDFLQHCPILILDRPRYNYHRATLLRSGVVQRLCAAAKLLAPRFHLSVIEGWRDPAHQRLQYEQTEARLRADHPEWPPATLRRMVNRYSAPPDGPAPAPHTTGGAVDLWLYDADGNPLDLHSPHEANDRRSFPMNAPGLSAEALSHRRLLHNALQEAGLTNYPGEYWHWSYGDQGWAYRGRQAYAVYGPVQVFNV